MNKLQLQEVMNYLDAEYSGIVARMTDDEKKIRARHWASEIGSLDFDAVMTAVRKLSRGQFMPRTAEILNEVENLRPERIRGKREICKIYRDASGNEVLDLRYSDGSEQLSGYLSGFPEWMQLKFRWMAEPNELNTLAWENYIMAHEERDNACSGMFPMVDALMSMVGGAAA